MGCGVALMVVQGTELLHCIKRVYVAKTGSNSTIEPLRQVIRLAVLL
jgi:succinate dehydrogenase/fumarate reductase-like Fe-S protein